VVAPDGTILHALSVIYIMREIDGVEQFKIRQTHLDRFDVQVVRGTGFPADGESRIREGLRRRVKAPVHVNVTFVDTLHAERSGKFRHVISDVPTLRPGPQEEAAAATAITGARS
jgi:phenylacetate-CoA ligase